jgi:pimeloyl-ACP methyl ester carboxylesterase
VAGALLAPRAADAAVAFAPCGEPANALCGTVAVPLDRSGAVAGTLGILVAKVPASSGTATGALLYLTGGPGDRGIPATASVASSYASALRTRDLYVIDYRGVGGSGPLSCPSAPDWRRCAEELGPQRHLYTTRDIVEDVEEVRRALGVDKVTIVAVSYGTKFGQGYALRYGDHVERLLLDSIVPLGGWDALNLSTYRSLGRILRETCARGRCRGITRDPLADVAAFAARVLRKAPTLPFVRPNGKVSRLSWDPRRDLWYLFGGDGPMVDHVARARWPSAFRSALQGDLFPLGRLLAASGPTITRAGGEEEFNPVAWRATKCEELASPWRGLEPPEARRASVADAVGRLAPEAIYPLPLSIVPFTPDVDDCIDWPEPPVVPAVEPAARFAGPTLILGGTQDMRTPLEDARDAAALFPGSTLLAVPDSGHGPSRDPRSPACALRAIDDFLAGKRVKACPAVVEPLLPPQGVAPAALDDVAPWPGVPGLAGKTLRAALETVLDVRYTTYSRGDKVGLRGGTFTVTSTATTVLGRPIGIADKATLRRIVYVPGVVVGGTVDVQTGTGKITVSGAGARGRLTIAKGRVTGQLGSAQVNVAYKPLLLGVLNRR